MLLFFICLILILILNITLQYIITDRNGWLFHMKMKFIILHRKIQIFCLSLIMLLHMNLIHLFLYHMLHMILARGLIFIRQKKTDLIAYFASNCNSNNNREEYIKELMKYIPVNSFGKCFNNKDELEYLKSKGISDNLSRREIKIAILTYHKFYLSFENTNAKDYLTEKYYTSFNTSTVPVVMGAQNVNDFKPGNHSIINVNDFKDPKSLAEYLLYLDRNEDKYQEYFIWRKEKNILPKFKEIIGYNKYSFQCRLCLFFTGNHDLKTGEKLDKVQWN